jgi:methylated-DNA-[protein]-cysteine S-methyltransferase
MTTVYYSTLSSKLVGTIFVASTEKGVCRIDFHTTEKKFLAELGKQIPGKIVKDGGPNRRVLSQLRKYLEGKLRDFDCPLDMEGTAFQKRVWSALKKIPYGKTRSYADVARAIGHPKAFRAVGNANGSNPIPIIVPCHRVIESNGGLGGYGSGIDIKKQLLEFERSHALR